MRVATITLIGLSLSVSAQQEAALRHRPAQVAGTVMAAPCPGAVIVQTDGGARYELDPSRISARAGQRMTARGNLYPRISRCKSAPWLEVVSSETDIRNAPSSVTSMPRRPLMDLSSATVIVVTRLAELDEGLVRARTLASRLPASLSIAVGVPGSPIALLSQMSALSGSHRELLSDIHVLALPDDTSGPLLLRWDEGDLPFSSVNALRAEVLPSVARQR